jgi:hypothetical protein
MAIRGNPERFFCPGIKWGDLDKATLEEMVDFFRKRVEICFFTPIHKLLLPEYKTTGFITLAVISSLIDLLSQYYYWGPDIKHKDKYKRFLRDHFPEFNQTISLKRYPHVKDFADFFYEGFRCQILHNFMLNECSTIGWQTTSLVQLHIWDKTKELKEIIVNPRLLLERLEAAFQKYMDDLLNSKNSDLRDSFRKKLFIDTGVKIK